MGSVIGAIAQFCVFWYGRCNGSRSSEFPIRDTRNADGGCTVDVCLRMLSSALEKNQHGSAKGYGWAQRHSRTTRVVTGGQFGLHAGEPVDLLCSCTGHRVSVVAREQPAVDRAQRSESADFSRRGSARRYTWANRLSARPLTSSTPTNRIDSTLVRLRARGSLAHPRAPRWPK